MENSSEKFDALSNRLKENTQAKETSKDASNDINMLDGYKVIEDCNLPHSKELYPHNWSFAYRSPTAEEVANFSTINEKDQPGVIRVTEDLIKKCVLIADVEKNQLVSTSEINDSDRLYFMLLLRDEYLFNSKLDWNVPCQQCLEELTFQLNSNSLVYNELTTKLINGFDGRGFTFDFGLESKIYIHIPTLKLTSKIFNYIVRAYRSAEKENKKLDKIFYDKQFLLFAPYLFESGDETIAEIIAKYSQLKLNENMFRAYLEIINKLKLGNKDFIQKECPNCRSLEVTDIRFPGWKEFFINTIDTSGYF